MSDNPKVSLKYIKAHTGLDDEDSLGNEGADKLANLALGLTSCPYRKERYYLKIHYKDKEIGKIYGTKWDPKKKQWYYEGFKTDKNFIELTKIFSV